MEEKNNLELKSSNKKKTLIAVIVVLAIALIALVIINLTNGKGTNDKNSVKNGMDQTEQTGQSNAPVSGESAPTISEVSGNPSTPTVGGEVLGEIPGEVAGTTAGKTEAPIEKTNPITVKVTIDAEKGFDPSSITVKAGQEVTLNITANGGVAIVVFDSALGASAVGVSNGQTKDVKFTAPVVRGEYSFHNDVPGRNQSVKFIVK